MSLSGQKFRDEMARGGNGRDVWMTLPCPACGGKCNRSDYVNFRRICCELCPGPASHERVPRDQLTREIMNNRRYPKPMYVNDRGEIVGEVGGLEFSPKDIASLRRQQYGLRA